MTSRTHDNFRHNFWTWVWPPPVWTMLKKTALFLKDGFPKQALLDEIWKKDCQLSRVLLEKKNENVFLEVGSALWWYWGGNQLAHKENIWWRCSWLNKLICKALDRISRKLIIPCTKIGWSSNYSIDLKKILLLDASKLIKICIAHVLLIKVFIESIYPTGWFYNTSPKMTTKKLFI